MRILTQMGGEVADAIREAAPDAEVVVVPMTGPVPPEIEGQALVASHRADNLVELAGRGVEWIHFFGTGVDGMPPEVLTGRAVTCSRGAGAVPISEWVLAMMLAFEKRLPDAWVREPPERWGWTQLGVLSGRTLGLVGLGGIGSAVATRASAFDMDVRATRRTEAPSPVQGVTVVPSLGDLLPVADHLVVAAPATPKTRHLLDEDAFRRGQAGRPSRQHRPGDAGRPGRPEGGARRRARGTGQPRRVRPGAAAAGSLAVLASEGTAEPPHLLEQPGARRADRRAAGGQRAPLRRRTAA